MRLDEIKEGVVYLHQPPYGKSSQQVKALHRSGNQWRFEWVSDDCSKGLRMYMNEIECERYIFEM